MRLLRASAVATAVALLTSVVHGAPQATAQAPAKAPGQAAAQGDMDPAKKVAGGGITAPGWKGKVDVGGGNKQGLAITDSKFASEGGGFRITTGPAAIYWNPANTAKGDYSVKATFKEPKQSYGHPHPFGVFIGGNKLESDQQSFVYCVAYRDGTFVIRQFNGPTATTLTRKTPHAAVNKATGPEAEVTNEVGWTVKGNRADCVINGQAVGGFDKTELVGAGKLESLDGVYGIRVSHNSEAVVTGFGTAK
jgi:hypothetical protein